MLMILLVAAGVAMTATVWAALALRPDPVAERMLRFAAQGSALPPPRVAKGARLPRVVEVWLARAGLHWGPLRLGCTLFGVSIGGALPGLCVQKPAAGILLGLLAFALWLRVSTDRRLRQLADQLPEALLLMATTLRSGFGFQQALQLVSREVPQPLGGEFAQLERDIALGLVYEEALERFQDRLGSTDAEMLAAALLVQRQTGGNLSEILLNLHDTIRDRQAVLGQVRTLTAQGRMSGVVLTAIPVVIAAVLYAVNRPYLMTLATDPRGRLMGAVALLLMGFAAFFIRRIVSIAL